MASQVAKRLKTYLMKLGIIKKILKPDRIIA